MAITSELSNADAVIVHPKAGETAKVIFQPLGRQGEIPTGTTLLEAARRLGVEIESICGGRQTCRKCKVMVETGDFAKLGIRSSPEHLTPPGERETKYATRYHFEPDARMSCACQVTGDLVIRVPEESQTRKQVVRKAAGIERPITVDAVMRLYYVELPTPPLKDHRGDWERLQAELRTVHGLENLRIDLTALRSLQPTLAASNRCVTVTVWNGQEVVQIQPSLQEDIYGIAVDVGTTTVAGHLCHLRTGEILATASRMNPQVPFGEDLMSRVSYAMMQADGTERMHTTIIDGLNGMVAELCAQADIQTTQVVEMVMVGNTTMHHLLLGVNPRELGGAPFSLVTHAAVDVKARDLGLHIAPGANVHIPPCEAGHVGADNVGVLVAEAPYNQDDNVLILDIGTNGELLLGNRQRVLSASSPTGPAFEGAQIQHGMRAAAGAIERVRIDPATLDVRYRMIGREDWIDNQRPETGDQGPGTRDQGPGTGDQGPETRDQRPETDESDGISGLRSPVSDLREARRRKRDEILNPILRASGICGSGIIEAIAELFKAGVIAPNGRFVPLDHPRLRTGLGDGGGKAEFVLAWSHETSTGREIVVHSDDIRAIQLAKAALYAGAKLLMQRLDLASVAKVVLAGGFGSYIDPTHAMILGLIPDCDLRFVQAVGNAAGDGARMILLDKSKRVEAQWAARWVTYIETAVEPTFQTEFVGSLDLPHSSDPFPHLAEILGEAKAQWPAERRLAFETMANSGRNQRTSREDRDARRAQRAQRRSEA
ncbi:MAG: ASKHA domain-containing protein [Caldilineaceae bacterium]